MLGDDVEEQAWPLLAMLVRPALSDLVLFSVTNESVHCHSRVPNTGKLIKWSEHACGACMQVIDECHHADSMHPFNSILEHYRQQNVQEQSQTQVKPIML